MAIVVAGAMSDCTLAVATPTVYAARAASPTPSTSCSVAPDARMVRTAESERSTADVISPTRTWVSRESRRMRFEAMTMVMNPSTTAVMVTASSTRSVTAMRTTAPMTTTTLETAVTRPEVMTARSSVVSVPMRDMRSPVRRWSYSTTGRASSRWARVRRVDRTTPSAVRASRNDCSALSKAPTTRITASSPASPATACDA